MNLRTLLVLPLPMLAACGGVNPDSGMSADQQLDAIFMCARDLDVDALSTSTRVSGGMTIVTLQPTNGVTQEQADAVNECARNASVQPA